MKVLIACEYSGTVRDAFIDAGHDAISCDLLPSTSNKGPHYMGDVRDMLGQPRGWDMVIAFPPCTHLAVTGAKHFETKQADGRQQAGIDFFMLFTRLDCPRVCIENPVGIMSTEYQLPDQIVQPYYFGDPVTKTTCLWLTGLRPLVHIPPGDLFDETTHVAPGEQIVLGSGKKMSKWFYETSCLPQADRAHARSKFWPGISAAMAQQWG